MGLTQTLVILLLTLRVLASPLAMRPESPRSPSKYRLVVRVCAWPAVRAQPSITARSLVPHPRGKGPGHGEGWDHAFGPQTLLSPVPPIFTRPMGLVSLGPLLGQRSVHLRC
jgi:hypothetical protein